MRAPKSGGMGPLYSLSGLVIETLKELSANRQPLTLSFLAEALARRQEIRELVPSIRESEESSGAGAPGNRDTVRSNGDYAVRQDPVQARDFRQAVEDKEKAVREKAVWRRSVLTVLSLADVPATGPVAEAASRFKGLVAADAGVDEMEEALGALRDAMMRSDGGPKNGNGAGDALISSLPDRKIPGPAGTSPAGDQMNRLRELYVSLLAEFNLDLGEEYVGRVAKITEKVWDCTGVEQLASLDSEIIELVQTFNKIVIEERLKVTDLIAEIGSGLVEMEKQFASSMNHTALTRNANDTFNNELESHMEDLGKSAQLSTTLTEFRSVVYARLASIREALATKRREDQLRQEKITSEMEQLQTSMQKMKQEIVHAEEKRKALEREVMIDPLTGIPNRRAYKRRFREELQRLHRYQQFFSILLLDIDYFKQVNDTYGHLTGDKCLKELTKRIKPALRECDFLARFGGEEFVVLLPGTDAENARLVAERICRTVANTRFVYRKQEVNLTISIGVTQSTAGDQTQEAMFTRVDRAMFEAKEGGRNRVIVA
jgi:diguanylate cyclase